MEAQQGTLLRRSQAASFAGLARRPRSGNRSHNNGTEHEIAPIHADPLQLHRRGLRNRGSNRNTEFSSSEAAHSASS